MDWRAAGPLRKPTRPAAMDAWLRVDLAQRAPLELGFAISHSAGWARLPATGT